MLIYSYDDKGRVTKMVEYDSTTLDLTSSVWQSYDGDSRIDGLFYTTAYGTNSYYYHDYDFRYNAQSSVTYVGVDFDGGLTDSMDVSYTYDDLQRATVREVKFTHNDVTTLNVKTNYSFKSNGTNTSILVSKYVSTVGSTATTRSFALANSCKVAY